MEELDGDVYLVFSAAGRLPDTQAFHVGRKARWSLSWWLNAAEQLPCLIIKQTSTCSMASMLARLHVSACFIIKLWSNLNRKMLLPNSLEEKDLCRTWMQIDVPQYSSVCWSLPKITFSSTRWTERLLNADSATYYAWFASQWFGLNSCMSPKHQQSEDSGKKFKCLPPVT